MPLTPTLRCPDCGKLVYWLMSATLATDPNACCLDCWRKRNDLSYGRTA